VGHRGAGRPPAREAGPRVTDPARLLLAAVRLDRESPEAAFERALADLEVGVGGFILFGGRCGDVRRLCARLREAAGRPLWLAADLERGAGQQFRGAACLPPPAALAHHPRPEAAVRSAARLTALEARALGLNWALAPVLDLDVEPRNPIVGTRSFGADAERVARLGSVWVEACQGMGVAACAKHFPGHGRTTADSHMDLPVVEADREALAEDLRPFRAVAGRVAGMMAAHVAYPALGCEGPASRSPEVLEALLRDEMGFEGLVVTDALVMAGFGGGGETGAATEGWRAVRAVRAGCDLLLYPGDAELVARTIRQAAANDAGLARMVERAADRSARTLARFGGVDGAGTDPPRGGGGAGDLLADLPAFRPEAPELTDLAAACVVPSGPAGEAVAERVDAWLAAAAGRVRIEVLTDEEPGEGESPERAGGAGAPAPEVGGRDGGPGAALARELERRDWRIGGPAAPGAGAAAETADTPVAVLVLLRATPRAWKGRAGLSEEARDRLRSLLSERPATLPVACGHPRLLEEAGVPGLVAWATEPVMERGVAAWLDERATSVTGA